MLFCFSWGYREVWLGVKKEYKIDGEGKGAGEGAGRDGGEEGFWRQV